MAKSFYIIDGHAQIYRAYYAPFRDLTSPTGEPTRATHVFCQMLFGLIRDRKPDYLTVALDTSDETVFRCDIDPNYKANRDPAPEDLHLQANRIVQIIEALGIPTFRKPGFEADDLMATMVETLRDDDVEIFLVSKDKDLEQLLSDRVRLFDIGKGRAIDPQALVELKGYSPEQAVEIQTLTGDSTDNVPGVPGIGPKTAAKLIAKYHTADNVVAHADELTPKMRDNVRAFVDQMPTTRQLVTLRRDVTMTFDLEQCKLGRLNAEAVHPIFEELGITRLRETLDALAGAATGSEQAALAPSVAVAPADRFDYQLVDSPEKLATFCKELAKQPSFAFDTETTGLNPVRAKLVGISVAWQAGQAYYIPIRAAMGDVLPVEFVAERLAPIFASETATKIAHNLKYDMLVLRQVGIDVRSPCFDTLIADALLEPSRMSHSLDALALTLTGHKKIPTSDLIGKGKSQTTMDMLDTKMVGEYACEDADFTWRIAAHLRPQLEASDFASLFHETEMPLVRVLADMEHAGIALDSKLLGEISEEMATRLEELSKEIWEKAGHPFNVDSPKQLAVVLFDELKLPVIKKTKTGRSTDAETLQTLAADTDNPIPKLVLEYRELAKLKGTYVDTLPTMVSRRTNRIHASFNQTGAITGRLSSSNPNLQNIPIRTPMGKRIRQAFIPGDKSNVLLAADYSQIELRLLAHFCKDPALCDACIGGQDIHASVAAQVHGVPLNEVTPSQRSAAKAVNFGIIYGQSAFGLSRALGIPIGEAKTFIDMYFMRYPGIRTFIDRCVAKSKQTGYAETILGRRRPIPELHSRNRQQRSFGERIAVNTVVQGSAADLIKRAMLAIHDELTHGNHSARMLIQVHDELVFEVPKTDVDAESEMIREKMVGALELDVPIVVDVAWGINWAEGK